MAPYPSSQIDEGCREGDEVQGFSGHITGATLPLEVSCGSPSGGSFCEQPLEEQPLEKSSCKSRRCWRRWEKILCRDESLALLSGSSPLFR
jgi:hypothetical protein